MAKYKVVGRTKVDLRPDQLFTCWTMPKGEVKTDDIIAIVSTPVYMTGDIVCSICLLDPEIDKSKEDVFDTIHRRQAIQFEINLKSFAESRGLSENYFNRQDLWEAKSLEFRTLVDTVLTDVHLSVKNCYYQGDDGKYHLDLEMFCDGIAGMSGAGFEVIAYPLKNPELLKNAVSSRSRFSGLVGKRKRGSSNNFQSVKKVLVVDSVESEKLKVGKIPYTKLTASFKDQADGSHVEDKSDICFNLSNAIYDRRGDEDFDGQVYVNIAFPRRDGSAPNFKKNSVVSIKCPVNKYVGNDVFEKDAHFEKIELELSQKLQNAYEGAFQGGSFLPMHEAGGFADRLKAAFGTKNVEVKHRKAEILPISFVIRALEELKYMEPARAHSKKVDASGQDVVKLADGTEVRTTNIERAQSGLWSKFSPDRWLAQNRSGVMGGVKEFVSYALSSKIGDEPLVNYPYAVEGYMEDGAKMAQTVDSLINHVKQYIRKTGLKCGSSGAITDQMLLRPRRPSRVNTSDIDIVSYMTGRGITQNVMDHVLRTGRMYYGQLESNITGAFFDCGYFGFSYQGKGNKPVSVQRFMKKYDGGIGKLFLPNALASGSAHEISTTGSESHIVLTEAIVDAYSYLSLVDIAGGDLSDYRICSLNSANYTHDWFINSFGVCPPKDGADKGLLVDESRELVSDFDAASYFSDAFTYIADDGIKPYDRIEFIHDGTPASDKAQEILSKVLAVAGVEDRLVIINDENRMSRHKSAKNLFVFDKGNVYATLLSDGIEYDHDKGGFVKYDIVQDLTPISTEVQRLKARNRIIDKVGASQFVLAYDNDEAGVSKSVDVFNLLSYLEIPVSVAMVPFESKNDNSVSHHEVLERLNVMGADVNHSFNENTLMNDVNDVLRKYHALLASGLEHEANSLVRGFLELDGSALTNEDKLSQMDAITMELKKMTSMVRMNNSGLFDLAKELTNAMSELSIAENRGYSDKVRSYRDVTNRLVRDIRTGLSAISDSIGFHVVTDKNFKDYSNACKKAPSMRRQA